MPSAGSDDPVAQGRASPRRIRSLVSGSVRESESFSESAVYSEAMIEVISAIILYLLAFPSLYGIMRIAVRHGVDDAARLAVERAEDTPREPTVPPAFTVPN